jgi:hypothetical protein
MALGTSSNVVNGQLVHVAPGNAFDPIGFGPIYTGPMFGGAQQYNVPPVSPSGALASAVPQSGSAAGGSMMSGFPMPTNASPSGSPWSLRHSPLWWGIGFLIIGILMLHHIHYRRG